MCKSRSLSSFKFTRAPAWPFKICLAWCLGAPVVRHSNNAGNRGDLHVPPPAWHWRLLSRNRQCLLRWSSDKAPVSSHPQPTVDFSVSSTKSMKLAVVLVLILVSRGDQAPQQEPRLHKRNSMQIFIFLKTKTSFLPDVYLHLFIVRWNLCQMLLLLVVIFK